MLCALTGILYARLAGRRVCVDWRDFSYSSDGLNAFPRFFEYASYTPTDEIPATDSVSPTVWRGHLHDPAWYLREQYGNVHDSETWRTFSVDLTKLDYQEDVVVLWTYNAQVNSLRCHFKGEFKGLAQASTEAILSKLLREDLRLDPQVRERVARFKGRSFGTRTVGVHVRYTDHRVGLWAILKQLSALLQREPELRVFLSTDNARVKSLFADCCHGVVTTSHWYPTPGLTIHQNRSCPSPIESGIEALVDLYLLAECDYLIGDTSSSFFYVAKLLSKAPDPNIFDVRRKGKLSPRRRRLLYRAMFALGLYSWGLSALSKFVRMQKLFDR